MIGSHRANDYRFQRTMSRETDSLEWEHRAPGLRAWRGDILAAVIVIILGTLAFPAASGLVDLLARW